MALPNPNGTPPEREFQVPKYLKIEIRRRVADDVVDHSIGYASPGAIPLLTVDEPIVDHPTADIELL